MSIAKRKDGRFIVKFKDAEGRWKQRAFRSEAEAERFDADCQYDSTENQRMTLLDAVLAYLKNHDMSYKTVFAYKFLINGHNRKNGTHTVGPAEFLASKYVDTLTRLDLETVRENCRRSGIAITTMNAYVGKLRAAMNWCVDQELIAENPWAKYKNVPGGKSKPRTGTLEDFAKIYPELPPWMQWAAKTAIALCLRPGLAELFSLRWDAFKWRTKSVSVFMPKVKNTKIVYPPGGYLKEAWERYKVDKAKGYTLVCRDRRDHMATDGVYHGAWYSACKKAGVDMPIYALRHIAASHMLAGGADLAAVAAQLGHKNMATTAAFYLHALPSAQKKAAVALPDCTNLVQVGAEVDEDFEL